MQPLTTQDMRTNIGTWAVPTCKLPAVAHFMHDALPNEDFDPHFYGQRLETTYFDTAKFELRKNRTSHNKYITLRVRCYRAPGRDETYALSAKTEQEKFRVEIPEEDANPLYAGLQRWGDYLPPNLYARLLEVSHEQDLLAVVRINTQRYAIEDDQDRFTLDTDIKTDLGKIMPCAVLEFKSTKKDCGQPYALQGIGLHPIKLSKYLWATQYR